VKIRVRAKSARLLKPTLGVVKLAILA